jgi:hypothetical protein
MIRGIVFRAIRYSKPLKELEEEIEFEPQSLNGSVE